MNKPILISLLLLLIGNVLVWFQSNSQFIWKWWYDHPLTTIFIYSIPTAIAFYFGWRYAVEAMGSLWSARMLTFGISTIMFAIMSYVMMGEGLNLKNGVCLVLSMIIIVIQVMWDG